jgi:N-acetylmuramoyl-L-alanine amidase
MNTADARLDRMRRMATGLVALALLALAAGPVLAQKAPATSTTPPKTSSTHSSVRDVARTTIPRGERVTVEFTSEVNYFSDRVPNPDRLYFDFKNAVIASQAASAVRAMAPGALVKSVRIAAHTEQTTRLVLEIDPRARYSVFELYSPYRLVIDVETDAPPSPAAAPAAAAVPAPTWTSDGTAVPPRVVTAVATSSRQSTAAPLESVMVDAPPASPAPPTLHVGDSGGAAVVREHAKPVALSAPSPASATSHGDYSLARQLGLGVSRVVIDPGHGGHDPGAQGNGINESELVLDVALRLEKLLHDQPGIDVVLTRRTDEFIPLEERTAIANREGADLFLSIHANASRQVAARGIETYFLNFATNPGAEAVAARENATSGRTMGNLPDLVKTIALNNKVAESRELATTVQTSLMRRVRLQNAAAKDLGVKQAPFVVLIGAQMPSVLAEISFVTNKADATLLKQGAYRQRLAQALCEAVVRYQASLKKVTTVAARDQER